MRGERWRFYRRLRASTHSATLLVSTLACSLVSEFDVHQCDSDAECRTLLGKALRCEDSRCVVGCQSNSECIAFDPRRPICPRFGGTCASLTSGDACPISSAYDDASMGPLTGENMTIIGGFATSYRSPTWLSASLAIDELNAARATATVEAPPAIVIMCNDTPEASRHALEHLVLDLGTHAILATLDNESLKRALTHAPTAGQAVFVIPGSLPLGADTEAAPGSLLWYLGGNQLDAARVFPALMSLVLPTLGGSAGQLPRVASLVGPDSEDDLLADAFESSLGIQGLGLQDLRRRGAYLRMEVQEPLSEDGLPSQLRDIAEGYAPQLVWVFVGPRLAERALTALEQALRTVGAAEPLYVLGPRSHDDSALRGFAASSATFGDRAIGIGVMRGHDASILDPLRERYSTAYPEAVAGGVHREVAPLIYDATYYLAYAMSHAQSSARILGTSASAAAVAGGMHAVTQPTGSRVTVGPGPGGLDLALPLLSRAEAINLIGTSGAAEFDGNLQVRSAPAFLFCWQPDGTIREVGRFDSRDGLDLVATPCGRSLFDAP